MRRTDSKSARISDGVRSSGDSKVMGRWRLFKRSLSVRTRVSGQVVSALGHVQGATRSHRRPRARSWLHHLKAQTERCHSWKNKPTYACTTRRRERTVEKEEVVALCTAAARGERASNNGETKPRLCGSTASTYSSNGEIRLQRFRETLSVRHFR